PTEVLGATQHDDTATASLAPTTLEPTTKVPPAATFDPEAAARAAERTREREARSARRWRRFFVGVASLVVLTVVGLGVAVTTGALPIGWGWGRHTYTPHATSELRHYRLFAGEQDIDLTSLQLRNGQTATVTI